MLTRQRLVGSDLGWMMDFPRYFVDATGSSDLPWQEAVAQDGLPEVLSVPTGRGDAQGSELDARGLGPDTQGLDQDARGSLPADLRAAIDALGAKPAAPRLRRVLLDVCALGWWTPRELAALLGLKDAANLSRKHLGPLVEAGELERRFPDNPAHPRQAYRAVTMGGP